MTRQEVLATASAQVAPTAGRNGGGEIDTGAPALGDDAAAAASRSSESVRRPDALQASVLDAQFLAEQGQLVLQADGDGDAIGGREQGDPGQGERVEDRGASPLRPTCGQSEREVALVRHRRTPPERPSSATLRRMMSLCRERRCRHGERSQESLAHYTRRDCRIDWNGW